MSFFNNRWTTPGKLFYSCPKQTQSTESLLQQPFAIFMHQLAHQTNIHWFKLFRDIFSCMLFHLSCIFRGHKETITTTCKVNQMFSTSCIKPEWNSVEADLSLEPLQRARLFVTKVNDWMFSMNLNLSMLMKFSSSAVLGVQIKLITLQTFHNHSFNKVIYDDVTLHQLKT